jgi:hypothetical protein
MSEAKTVASDMAGRRVFDSADKAAEYLNAVGESMADFGNYPLAAPGIDSEGNFDSAIYGDGIEVIVATLKNKSTVKAIVVAPVPTLDALLANDGGRAWVQKIIHKELNHVAVRALREAEDVSTVIDQMPTTLDGYIASGREGGAGILESFNELYKPVNAVLSAKVPVWAKARLIKSELKKCMESRGYALEFYPALEDRGEGKDSLFLTALDIAIKAAERKGLDATIFERWKATRNAKTYTTGDDADEDFDVDSLTDSLLDDDSDGKGEADNGTTDA